jgi:guanylate kinase
MIIFICGQTGAGKDTIGNLILERLETLEKSVPYTTRPKREGEVDGKDYYFVDNATFNDLNSQGEFLETRSYDTAYGIWRYATRRESGKNVLLWGSYGMLCNILKDSKEDVHAIYIDVSVYDRLQRSLEREEAHDDSHIAEVCRRIYQDYEDFRNMDSNKFSLTLSNIDLEKSVKIIENEIKDIIVGDYMRKFSLRRGDS